jgi:hypothetical protein
MKTQSPVRELGGQVWVHLILLGLWAHDELGIRTTMDTAPCTLSLSGTAGSVWYYHVEPRLELDGFRCRESADDGVPPDHTPPLHHARPSTAEFR